MADKYEATLQDWLAKCDGDWETLARALYKDHPIIVAERNAEKKELVALFGFNKPYRKRGKSLAEIITMLDRIAAISIGHNGQPRHSSRISALKCLSLTRKQRDEWEKVLAEFNAELKRRRKARPRNSIVTNFGSYSEYAHDDNCPGCYDCSDHVVR